MSVLHLFLVFLTYLYICRYIYIHTVSYLSIYPSCQETRTLHSDTERQHSDSSFPVTSAALSCKKKVQSQWNHQEIGWNNNNSNNNNNKNSNNNDNHKS